MRRAVKKFSKKISAYCLGEGSRKEKELITVGKIRVLPQERYELYSQEAVNGQGEAAHKGDYFKIDNAGFPYPNEREWFLQHHRHIDGDVYEQINEPLYIWQAEDEMGEEILYLLNTGKLTLCPQDDKKYFTAFLWGARLSAAKDATVVFYHIDRDEAGKITDISFNFVAKEEFEKEYRIVE